MSGYDRREQILVRLVELMAENYVQAATVVRNRGLLAADVRPAVAIMDGDEISRVTGDQLGRGIGGRPGIVPHIVTMSPEIFVVPKPVKPSNEGVGTLVNDFRMAIGNAIANDPVLISIVGPNGSIAYLGMVTDLKSGSACDGQSKLNFSFTYPLDLTN